MHGGDGTPQTLGPPPRTGDIGGKGVVIARKLGACGISGHKAGKACKEKDAQLHVGRKCGAAQGRALRAEWVEWTCN